MTANLWLTSRFFTVSPRSSTAQSYHPTIATKEQQRWPLPTSQVWRWQTTYQWSMAAAASYTESMFSSSLPTFRWCASAWARPVVYLAFTRWSFLTGCHNTTTSFVISLPSQHFREVKLAVRMLNAASGCKHIYFLISIIAKNHTFNHLFGSASLKEKCHILNFPNKLKDRLIPYGLWKKYKYKAK